MENLTTLHCLAPAKLNLFLHVVGQRADGYHNLQTVFQFLDYCDELHFTLRSDRADIQLHPDFPDIPLEQNLIFRTARLLQETSGTSLGVDIHVQKRLPIGGGVGGGSSDAATTLVALNQLWQLHLTQTDLLQLGLSLGADVPIFIYGKAAWAEGVGEQLQAIDLPEAWYLVLVPACQINTGKIFSDRQLTRDTPAIRISDFLQGQGHNDCEPIVRRDYPPVAAALDWLNQFAPARMTGTGSCVFAAFPSERHARRVAAQIPTAFGGFVAKGVNSSPLYNTTATLI